MKMSVLQMVQNILSSMESDEVNSISDTVEAFQVAEEIRTAYYDLIALLDIPSQEGLIRLNPSNDPNVPNILILPDNVKQVKWVKYLDESGTGTGSYYHDLVFMSPEDFLFRTTKSSGNTDNYENIDINGTIFQIVTNKAPRFWTTFDNRTMVFDSYMKDLETTLKAKNTMAWGEILPGFELEDDFIPQLDINLFPLLLAEAKKACFINFKQVSNSNEEVKARRHLVRSQNDRNRFAETRRTSRGPNYGRRR